ncbi:uncharacterized protein LOC106169026 isoform X2 [Lingula anatina]|uniref:Uncharacterized protein LOC106169026 isoform X2 n=1 Tax=Lingula anatina TaxID=7574 RepID=A0A1S3J1R8_LINAN|nr:uncharacterized protein LOC106169026 isoform X2 [Lingula anatina]|eukprot:XP_013403769.1 uncharacterized protein LOC106169026 isoform X2 [Lingula anatina]
MIRMIYKNGQFDCSECAGEKWSGTYLPDRTQNMTDSRHFCGIIPKVHHKDVTLLRLQVKSGQLYNPVYEPDGMEGVDRRIGKHSGSFSLGPSKSQMRQSYKRPSRCQGNAHLVLMVIVLITVIMLVVGYGTYHIIKNAHNGVQDNPKSEKLQQTGEPRPRFKCSLHLLGVEYLLALHYGFTPAFKTLATRLENEVDNVIHSSFVDPVYAYSRTSSFKPVSLGTLAQLYLYFYPSPGDFVVTEGDMLTMLQTAFSENQLGSLKIETNDILVEEYQVSTNTTLIVVS